MDWGRILDFFGLRSRLVLHAVSGLTNQPGLLLRWQKSKSLPAALQKLQMGGSLVTVTYYASRWESESESDFLT